MKKISDIVNYKFDAIVIGSGIGGATAAHQLILSGKKVLLLEKGPAASDQIKLPLWTEMVTDVIKKSKFHPFLGEGIGGSSRLYGMVMERLEARDFKANGGSWPSSENEWRPYFEEAEAIYGVKPAIINPAFNPLLKHLEDQGLKPDALKLAYKSNPDCQFCQSRLCEKSCKIDAWSGPLEKIKNNPNLTILTNVDVQEILTDSSRAIGVTFSFENSLHTVKAESFYLGLGALRTPYLLNNSRTSIHEKGIGNSRDLLGRYLMRHYVDLYFLDWKGSELVNIHKSIGLNDFYKEMGIFQSFGSLPPIDVVMDEVLRKASWVKFIPGVKFVLEKLINNMFSKHVMASIIEDSPQHSNRLIFGADKNISFEYKISSEDKIKIENSRKIAKTIFSSMLKNTQYEAENNKRLAHVCGTCKMGESIKDSVVNWNGRVHELENLYIVDSSVFPSSTGKNPSLTIAANALRTTKLSLAQDMQ